MRFTQTTSLIAVLLTAVLAGCSQQTTDSNGDKSGPASSTITLTNAVCPMEGGKASDAVTVEWNGKTIGFCCPECIPAWNELSDEEKEAQLAAALPDAESGHDHSNHQEMSHDAS